MLIDVNNFLKKFETLDSLSVSRRETLKKKIRLILNDNFISA